MSIEENGSRVESSREDHAGTSTFDSAARGLADGSVSRGKALRMLAASLFGGALVAAPAVAVAAPKPGGTGCPKPGEIRVNGKCQCNTAEGLVTCGASKRCVDPNACGGGQHVDTETCKCVCDNPGETLCPGTGNCVSNACPEGAVLETSGESCECQCRNTAKEIVGTQCVCKDPNCPNAGEVRDPDTCVCACPEGTNRCRNSLGIVACVSECQTGEVLKDCVCVPEVTCAGICPEGCCDQGTCLGGDSNTACGTAGGPCVDCAALGQVCVNGECKECATNADCDTNVNNAHAICTANNTCDFACNDGFTLIDGACCANANVCGGVCLTSGCCQAGVGQPGTTNAACGTGGGACAVCGAGQTCTSGTCQSTCRAVSTACTDNAQCCSGRCRRGAGAGTGCGSNSDCTCRAAV